MDYKIRTISEGEAHANICFRLLVFWKISWYNTSMTSMCRHIAGKENNNE